MRTFADQEAAVIEFSEAAAAARVRRCRLNQRPCVSRLPSKL